MTLYSYEKPLTTGIIEMSARGESHPLGTPWAIDNFSQSGDNVKSHQEVFMPRLTITLSEERHQALKETAARSRKSIAAIIEESLELSGIKTTASATELVAQARARSSLDENQAFDLALEETRAQRAKK